MMAGKAHLFADEAAFEAIMNTDDPGAQKRLGRAVHGFEEKRWSEACEDIVVHGNMYKFSQNQELGKYLIATDARILVEGNPRDVVWGVGLSWDDPRIEDKKNWRGRNLLGKSLEIVRPLVRELRLNGGQIDPWNRTIVSSNSRASGRG